MSIMNKETLSVSPCCRTVECRTDQDTTITPIISHSDTLPPSLLARTGSLDQFYIRFTSGSFPCKEILLMRT